jgi:hypothetical protein
MGEIFFHGARLDSHVAARLLWVWQGAEVLWQCVKSSLNGMLDIFWQFGSLGIEPFYTVVLWRIVAGAHD